MGKYFAAAPYVSRARNSSAGGSDRPGSQVQSSGLMYSDYSRVDIRSLFGITHIHMLEQQRAFLAIQFGGIGARQA